MAREVGQAKAEPSKCSGGRSFNCYRMEHNKSSKWPDIFCYRCGARMGCGNCCERPNELLCLECHNWATKRALRYHGNIVPNPKVPRVRTDRGWITANGRIPEEIDKIIERAKPSARILSADKSETSLPFLDESEEKAKIEERKTAKQKLMDQARILQADDMERAQ